MADIVLQLNKARINAAQRGRYESAVRRAVAKVPHAVKAVVRFEEDGDVRHVEVVISVARQSRIVAEAEARWFAPALTQALGRVASQSTREKRQRAPRARALGRAAARR